MSVALIMFLLVIYCLQHGQYWVAVIAIIAIPFALIYWRMPR